MQQVQLPASSAENAPQVWRGLRLRARRHGRLRIGYFFMIPALAVILVFMIGPALWSIYISLTDASLSGAAAAAPQFTGFGNYVQIFHSSDFYNSLRVSFLYLVFSALIGQAVLGLLLALLMRNRHPAFKAVLGSIIVAAWVIPEVVAGFLWISMYSGGKGSFTSEGVVNLIVMAMGFPQQPWIQKFPTAAIIVANTWRGTAFSMLLYASALEGLPGDVLEAASIDGAGLWQKLVRVTLPLIKGSIATDLLLITLATLSDFTQVFVMTGGGIPGANLLTIYQYQQAFQFYQIGFGSAIALLIIAFGAILGLIYIRILKIEF